ncbi:hypothetical protein N7495_006877 [Penicillium taxi]|uniref:uncharacterized protein n=1 Tax=Penicillium taxi TaxID=168475 RepID=UPI002545733D|nr:uncharacterized protein N7495_006877 [Penicillium taxi]KAJ5895186.1 hypothetical protein N7495_006877 [Penicillium taxi]
MSSFSENPQVSSSQLRTPQLAQPIQSLFGGPSSDAGPLSSSQPGSPQSLFGGPRKQEIPSELDFGSDAQYPDHQMLEDDDFNTLMRERPLLADYGSDGDSYRGSEDENPKKGGRRATKSAIKSDLLPEKAYQPAYLIDPGIDLPLGTERPNRWTRYPHAYRRAIREEHDLYTSLIANRSRDLGAHLYNAFVIRNQSNQAQADFRDDEDVDDHESISFRKSWVAWPMPADSVPRTDELIHRTLDGPDNARRPPDLRPSAELEESIMAFMMKTAKDRFSARAWDHDDLGIKCSESSPHLDAMVVDDEDETKHETEEEYNTSAPLRPVIQADDDISRKQLRPLSRNVMSQLDRLLMGLHHAQRTRVGDDLSSDSGTDGEDEPSRSGPRRKRSNSNQSRGRKLVRPQSRGKANGRSPSPRESPGAETENEEMLDSPKSQRRAKPSRNGLPIKSRVGLRDWSEVMGLAPMMGIPSDAVNRALKRCTDLFGQDMTFRKFREGRMEKVGRLSDSTFEYAYFESESESDPPRTHKRVKATPKSRSQSSSRPQSQGLQAPASSTLPTASSPVASSSNADVIQQISIPKNGAGKGPHRKSDILCPIKKCTRHTNGFSRTWNLNLHMKRVHPTYDSERVRSRSASTTRGATLKDEV